MSAVTGVPRIIECATATVVIAITTITSSMNLNKLPKPYEPQHLQKDQILNLSH